MKLIIGLGNPGSEYAENRHNIGFMCLSYLAKQHGIRFDKKQGKARTGAGVIAGQDVLLARPQTYMNRSGESVALLMQKFKVAPEDLLVIYDDLDLPLGKIRIRRSGSSGGHNGIKSIMAELGSEDFSRIRIGIGRPEPEPDAAEDIVRNHVLSDFTPEEEKVVSGIIPLVSEVIVHVLEEGIDAAMNRYN